MDQLFARDQSGVRKSLVPAAAPPSTLDLNLAELERTSPAAARAVRAVEASPDVRFGLAPDGSLTGDFLHAGGYRRLASAHRPIPEAESLVADFDPAAAGVVVVSGFGLGHHLRPIAERMKRTGLIVVFEPNVALLRAVLGHVDCTPWLSTSNVVVLTDENETGELSGITRGFEAAIACGLRLIEHPPSRPLIGDRWNRFAETFTQVVKAVRTAVVTTLVHVDISLRNALQNIDHYVSWPGINDLVGVATGRAAIVVSAGPSLARNLHLLEDARVRDRFVIIAAQTVLKPLLARGIKPHYVTALDYHEISRRFYEGLSAQDVEGITLVVEPKANPAILEAFPGAIRCVADQVLDETLGAALYESRAALKPGATVAHLAYSLARAMGADPVMLIGQDLGFTDHCYYSANAAIHRVWGPELGHFRTLEMLEWERIARMKGLLRRITDQSGRPMFTDEQMATYLVQFERDFLEDAQRGLTIIDASEGGCHKRHTTIMTLAEALDRHASPTRFDAPPTALRADAAARVAAARSRISSLAVGVGEMESLSLSTKALLAGLRDCRSDERETNRIIGQVHENAARVGTLGTSHWLVQYISQTSQLRRFRSDRALELAGDSLAPLERQSREIQRDLSNVTWLAESAARVRTLLHQADGTLNGAPRHTSEDTQSIEDRPPRPRCTVGAVLVFDPRVTGLNTLRPPATVAQEWLKATLVRLSDVVGLDGVLALVPPGTQFTDIAMNCRLETLSDQDWRVWQAHRARIGAARAFQPASWRGGIANTTIFDEACCPAVIAAAAARHGWDAALIVGADWTGLDPALNTALLVRYRELETSTVVFSQAAPGLAGAVAPVTMLAELAASKSRLATFGGVLGYLPAAPQADPIAKSACVGIAPSLRDGYRRCISAEHDPSSDVFPSHIEIVWERGRTAARELRSPSSILAALAAISQHRRDLAVTFDLRPGEAATLPETATLCTRLARAAGIAAVHIRLAAKSAGPWLHSLPCEVVSLDFGTHPSDDDQQLVLDLVNNDRAGHRWLVPRLTKSAENLERMEGWYDFWLTAAGSAVIDPPEPGDRLTPLLLPELAAAAHARTTWRIEPSGRITAGVGVIGDLTHESMSVILDRVRAVSLEAADPPLVTV